MYEFLDEQLISENLVFVAAAIQAAALLFQGQIRIRVLLLVGSTVYLIYYMSAATEPLWEAMIATLAMSIANVYGLAAIVLGNTIRSIPADHIPLYSMFGGIEPNLFRCFMKQGQIRKLSADEDLTVAGAVPQKLYFVIEGDIELEKGNEFFSIPAGHFVGEVSLMLGTQASATARVRSGSQVVEWPRDQLLRKMSRHPRMKIAVESLIGRDMARKVAVSAGRIDYTHLKVDGPMSYPF